jgi:hypothetical protein
VAAKTTAERQQAFKAAQKAAGMVRLSLYCHPGDRQAIRDSAAKIARNRVTNANNKGLANSIAHAL